MLNNLLLTSQKTLTYLGNMILFTDVETTGFAKSGRHDQPDQARMCQLALVLTDTQGNIKAQFSSLIKPDGWTITDSAYNTHGISMEDCEKYGLPISVVMHQYYWFMFKAGLAAAHNIRFEKRIFEIEEACHKDRTGENLQSAVSQKRWYCTQDNSRNVCRIPPTDKMRRAKRTGFKTPSLAEAYYFFTGKVIEKAHDAMEDTIACKDIYFGLVGKSAQQSVAQPSGQCYNYGRSIKK